jgi:hypothetical protein
MRDELKSEALDKFREMMSGKMHYCTESTDMWMYKEDFNRAIYAVVDLVCDQIIEAHKEQCQCHNSKH